MNDLQKAKALILNRQVRLKTVSEKTDIPYATIRSYVSYPEKMETAAWIRIHKLAGLYDEMEKTNEI